jgi:hypothetical protein
MNDDSLLREINEDIRRDKARDAWNRNRGMLIALVVAIVVGTAGGQVYRTQKAKHDSGMTSALLDAKQELESGKPKEAAALLKQAAAKESGEDRALLQSWQARAELTAGDDAAAEATMADIIKTAAKDSAWRDLACIWTAGLKGAMPEACAGNGQSPLRGVKHEMAAATAMEAGDFDRARAELASLRALPNATPEQQARAMQLELLLPPQESAAAK